MYTRHNECGKELAWMLTVKNAKKYSGRILERVFFFNDCKEFNLEFVVIKKETQHVCTQIAGHTKMWENKNKEHQDIVILVKFQAETYGNYSQEIIFDFGGFPKVVKELGVQVLSEKILPKTVKHNPQKNENNKLSWSKNYKIKKFEQQHQRRRRRQQLQLQQHHCQQQKQHQQKRRQHQQQQQQQQLQLRQNCQQHQQQQRQLLQQQYQQYQQQQQSQIISIENLYQDNSMQFFDTTFISTYTAQSFAYPLSFVPNTYSSRFFMDGSQWPLLYRMPVCVNVHSPVVQHQEQHLHLLQQHLQ